MTKIPLYQPSLDKREEAVLNVIRSGKLSRGIEVDLFEKEFADFVGKKMENSFWKGQILYIMEKV